MNFMNLHIPIHPICERSYYQKGKICLVYPESRKRRRGIFAEDVIEEILIHEFLHSILRGTISIQSSKSLDKISRWKNKRIIFHFLGEKECIKS